VLVAEGIADGLAQFLGNQFLICSWRRHSLDKSLNLTGDSLAAIIGKPFGENSPASCDLAPCFDKRAFTGFDA